MADLRAHLDILEEKRHDSALRQAVYKSMMEKYYNKKVKATSCKVGDLVLRKNEASGQESTKKLGPNWEGPYRVIEARKNGSYVLETMQGKQLPRTWNIRNLRKFHF